MFHSVSQAATSTAAFNSFSLDKDDAVKISTLHFGLDSCQPAGGPLDAKCTVFVDVSGCV